ncbi:hypothetical protein JCM6882_003919 [Rhodosporidiobolus microsporus]
MSLPSTHGKENLPFSVRLPASSVELSPPTSKRLSSTSDLTGDQLKDVLGSSSTMRRRMSPAAIEGAVVSCEGREVAMMPREEERREGTVGEDDALQTRVTKLEKLVQQLKTKDKERDKKEQEREKKEESDSQDLRRALEAHEALQQGVVGMLDYLYTTAASSFPFLKLGSLKPAWDGSKEAINRHRRSLTDFAEAQAGTSPPPAFRKLNLSDRDLENLRQYFSAQPETKLLKRLTEEATESAPIRNKLGHPNPPAELVAERVRGVAERDFDDEEIEAIMVRFRAHWGKRRAESWTAWGAPPNPYSPSSASPPSFSIRAPLSPVKILIPPTTSSAAHLARRRPPRPPPPPLPPLLPLPPDQHIVYPPLIKIKTSTATTTSGAARTKPA